MEGRDQARRGPRAPSGPHAARGLGQAVPLAAHDRWLSAIATAALPVLALV